MNCLCTAHNTALSPLDAEAGRFYRALEDCLHGRVSPRHRFLFSGHDIERWLLKTLLGLAASKNLAENRGERLPGFFTDEISIPELLQDPSTWRTPMGIYFPQKLGANIRIGPEFGLAPLSSEKKEIGGLISSIQGFQVVLVIVPSTVIEGSSLDGVMYRLENLHINLVDGKRSVNLSWTARVS
jgi:hypothetical protein